MKAPLTPPLTAALRATFSNAEGLPSVAECPPGEGEDPRRRTALHQGRRARQGHRADQVRGRRDAAADAALQAAALQDRAREDRLDRRLEGAGACPASSRSRPAPILPIAFGILPVSQDEHALCTDRVRFVGDPVAAVAAVDEDAAFDALDAIEVALRAAPADRHDRRGRSRRRRRRPASTTTATPATSTSSSRWSSATRRPASRAPTGSTRTSSSTRATRTSPLEQHAAVADFGPDGKLTLWSSTQTPHYVHRALAKVLEMPAAQIRVIATPNGGGFGGKSDPFNHEIVVAHLSRVTGRPVKICLTREEVFYCHRGRHPVLMQVKTGVKKDGAITAMHFKTVLDGGGYGSYGVASTYYTGALQTVTYRIPTYRFDGARVFTNKPPCGPKRGHGTPQPRFALEVQLDKIACDLGIDPAEIRRRHLQPRELPDRELPPRRLDRAGRVHRQGRRGVGLEEAAREAAARPRPGSGLLLVPLRRRAADLLERDAAVRASSSSSTAAAASRSSAAPRRSARARTRSSRRSSPRCWASIPSTSASSPATRT